MPSDAILRSDLLDKKLLQYILDVTDSADGWWSESVPGSLLSHRERVQEFRQRYDAQRSTAGLASDTKNEPFPNSANIGIGVEQIFGEFLIPTLLANTFDLTPMLQALDPTDKPDDALTAFHDDYQRREIKKARALRDESTREILKVGSVFHKWTWASLWREGEVSLPVWVSPMTGQPVMQLDPSTGSVDVVIADPTMPEELRPTDPTTGRPLKLGQVPSVDWKLRKHGPQLSIRPLEAIGFPPSATSTDPDDWDWVSDDFSVSPWWFLGREGDPFDGNMQQLDKLWKWLGVNPHDVARRPDGRLTQKIKLREFHGKFPITVSGKPAEVLALVAMARRGIKATAAWKARARIGGLAAAASMTSEERVARARKAAQARWSKEAPDGR